MNKAVILFSGGQDSTTCLYWAKKRFNKVYAVGFDYGQKHKIELDAAQKICDKEKINYKIFDVNK
jgi:7-cyano-7-deazaguanine synthase